MIETLIDLTQFQLENHSGDWIVHVVPENPNVHPAVSCPSIIFIRNVLTGKSYYYSCNHPDSKSKIDNAVFLAIIRDSPNRKWALDKKSLYHMIGDSNVFDANLIGWMKLNETIELSEYDTPAHFMVRKNACKYDRVNMIIPLLKHKEAFDEMADDLVIWIDGFEVNSNFIRFNNLIVETLGELEKQGIHVDRLPFKNRFDVDVGTGGLVYSQYNVYTATGRPSNRYAKINYAALNQSDGTRKCFTSRYGKDGQMIVMDYTTFHPRIISRLVKYDIPITIDIYEYLAKLYFNKKMVDETDIKAAKAITFRQFYGGIEDKYSHIKYLASIKDFMAEQWVFFQSNGYVLTPFFNRRITAKHILEPNPHKVFNYLLQATEGELAIPKVKIVLEYLRDKQTKAMLYVYDSIMLDFHKDDGIETLRGIHKIMSFDGRFPMKAYMGETYQDVKQIYF